MVTTLVFLKTLVYALKMVVTEKANILADLGLVPGLILPLSKLPQQKNWQKTAWEPTWSGKFQENSNIALLTGFLPSATQGLVCVDLDSIEALEWARGQIPETPLVTYTQRGEHWYYRLKRSQKIRNKVKFAIDNGTVLDLDIRGQGGYALIAPSKLENGFIYTEKTPWTKQSLESTPYFQESWFSPVKKHETLAHSQETIQTGSLTEWVVRLSQHPDWYGSGIDKARLQKAFLAILDNTPMAFPGCRGTVVRDVCFTLVKHLDHYLDTEIVEFLTPGISLLGEDWEENSDWGIPGVFKKLQTARAKLQPEISIDSIPVDPKTLVLVHTGGTHGWFLTKELVYSRQWSLSSIYQFRKHEFGLGWAITNNIVSLFNKTEKGTSQKTRDQFFSEYSSPVEPDNYKMSTIQQTNCFDKNTRVFTEAVAPLRPHEPEFNEQINQWLRALSGENYQRLCEWLATVTLLDRPTPILCFIGLKNTGKNLFMEGVSRLWHTVLAPSFNSILGNFNEALAKSPLLISDEYLPEQGPNKVQIFEYLREFVTARSHTVNRKNMPLTTVEGCARLIFASNKADNLKFENYSAQAREALAERLLCIYPGKEAQDYLSTIDRITKESWVAEGIAKHALWLRDNLQITYTGRLLVEGNGDALISLASNLRGIQGFLCEAMCRVLENPSLVQSSNLNYWLIEQNKLFVATAAFENKTAWAAMVPSLDGRLYSATAIGTALGILSVDRKKRRYKTVHGLALNCTLYEIDLPQLFMFVQRTGVADLEAVQTTLKTGFTKENTSKTRNSQVNLQNGN